MKEKLLIISLSMMLTGSVFAQGRFIFSASAGSVKYNLGTPAGTVNVVAFNGQPTIPGYGNLTIQVWSAPAGTAVLGGIGSPPVLGGAWALDTFNLIKIFPLAGAVAPATIITPASSGAATGGNVQVEIVGWSGTATTFAQAVADSDLLTWSGENVGPLGWLQSTGVSPSPTPPIRSPANGGFAGLFFEVPEPSTLALGGLGAAALLLFRATKIDGKSQLEL